MEENQMEIDRQYEMPGAAKPQNEEIQANPQGVIDEGYNPEPGIKDRENVIKKDVEDLLSPRLNVIDKLCAAYFQYHDKPNFTRKIHSEVMAIITDIKSESGMLQNMEKLVDKHLDGVMTNFKKDFPDVQNWEYSLFLLNILNFSTFTISLIQDTNVNVIYNRKNKLKNKIKSKGAAIAEKYLKYLK